jgi:hypothetical protein
VTDRGADEFWSEGIASDANPFLAVFCRLERQTINRILSMRRQIGFASRFRLDTAIGSQLKSCAGAMTAIIRWTPSTIIAALLGATRR